jgi:hypothetical protein
MPTKVGASIVELDGFLISFCHSMEKKVIENIFSLCLNVEQFFYVEKTDKKNSGCICESLTRVRDCQN